MKLHISHLIVPVVMFATKPAAAFLQGDSAAISRGAELNVVNCASCHGAELDGLPN